MAAWIFDLDFFGANVSVDACFTGVEKLRTSHEETNAIAGFKSKFIVKIFFRMQKFSNYTQEGFSFPGVLTKLRFDMPLFYRFAT
jgi:hypothetical protein